LSNRFSYFRKILLLIIWTYFDSEITNFVMND